MTNDRLTPADLSRFIHSELYFAHLTHPRLCISQGVQFWAEKAEGYWFLDLLAKDLDDLRKTEDFILIELVAAEGTHAAYIHAEDKAGSAIYSKTMSVPGCPAGEWRFVMAAISEVYGAENAIMLQTEY